MKALMSIILAIVLLLFSACSINEPSLPSFQKKILVELTPDQFTMGEALDDESLRDSVFTAGDTLVYIDVSDSTEKQSIQRDDLAFKADDDRIVKEVGPIDLDEPEPAQTEPVTIADLFSMPLSAGDTLPPIPAQTFTPPAQTVMFDSYMEVIVDSGFVRVAFNNNLILTIDSGLKIYLYDNKFDDDPQNGLIDSLAFSQPIPPGTNIVSDPINLSGRLLSNEFRIEYSVPIAAVDTATVLDQSDIESSYYSEVRLSNFTVDQAVAKIPEQEIIEEDQADIDTEDKSIRRVRIDEGRIHLTIDNFLAINADLEITLLNLFNPDGAPRKIMIPANANEQTQRSINIADHVIRDEQSGNFVDALSYHVRALTEPTDGFVTISSSDSIVVTFSMDSAYAGFFEGRLEQTSIEIDPVETDELQDLEEVSGELRLPNLQLVLNIYNQINFDVTTQLTLTGKRTENGAVVNQLSIPVDAIIEAGSSDQAKRTRVILDSESSNPSIVDLMAILPTQLTIEGDGVIDGDGSVSLEDAIWVEYHLESPMTLDIGQALKVESDPDSLGDDELSEDVREQITDNVAVISLRFEGDNSLALGPQFMFFLTADKDELFDPAITDSASKVVLSAGIDAAPLGPDGLTEDTVPFTVRFEMNEQQLQIFKNDKIYYGALINIPPTDEDVTFRKSDALQYRGTMEIEMMVNPDDE